MKKSIHDISAFWINQFLNCIKNTFTEPQFRTFTLFIDEVDSFDNVREKNGYYQDLPLYLEYLRKNGSLGMLVKKYIHQNDLIDENHPIYKPFKEGLLESYDLNKTTTESINTNEPYNFNTHLLLNNAFPFINRDKFRNDLIDRISLSGQQPRAIFVKGASRSGMSYLGNFLNDFCAHSKEYKYVEIDVPYYLDADNLNGTQLAKTIALKLKFKDEIDDRKGDKFKFIQFANNLSKSLSENSQIPIVFLHDFHKIPVLESINALFYEIFSLSPEDINNIIFVIAGFDYENIRNWHNSLSSKVLCCELDLFVEADIDHFLNLIYNDYQPKLKTAEGQPLSLQDYTASMKAKLMPDNNIEVALIGNYLKKHLMKLNS